LEFFYEKSIQATTSMGDDSGSLENLEVSRGLFLQLTLIGET
jgi:hypothetical protein